MSSRPLHAVPDSRPPYYVLLTDGSGSDASAVEFQEHGVALIPLREPTLEIFFPWHIIQSITKGPTT